MLRTTGYTPNALNQYDSITHPQPGWLVLRGSLITTAGNSVTIDGNAPTLTTGSLWFHEQSVDNTGGPLRRLVEITATRPDGGRSNGPVTRHQKGALFIPPPSEMPTYDEDGNLTSDARWNYVWDGENRLIVQEENTGITVQPAGATVTRKRLEFSYDAQGRRISKRVLSATGSGSFVLQQSLVFLYDGWNMIAEIDTTSSAQVLRSYEWGMDLSGTLTGAGGVGGLLVERFHTAPTAGTYAPCYDGNGNVTELVNLADGSVSARYEYGVFGETISVDGGAVAQANPFRFSTKYLDAETGLYNYGFRYYDTVNGRWPNRDPIGEKGGVNLYGMVGNDPVNSIDILGKDRWIMGALHTAIYVDQYDSNGKKMDCKTRVDFGPDLGSGRNGGQLALYVVLRRALAGSRGGAYGAALSLTVLKGAIYVTPDQSLPIQGGRVIKSSQAQDELFLELMSHLDKDMADYITVFFNCRHFVDQVANYPMQDLPGFIFRPISPLTMPGTSARPVRQEGHYVIFVDDNGNEYPVWGTMPVDPDPNPWPMYGN
ncbi:MAG: hypothetical protein B7Z37_29535 [Verrucomicrobia bacterium 12-59-8]|nr:MAG: hypothetical protein B7Z37_29535 [Verrucomicrobia bacterium 12-59-8]